MSNNFKYKILFYSLILHRFMSLRDIQEILIHEINKRTISVRKKNTQGIILSINFTAMEDDGKIVAKRQSTAAN